MKTTEKVLQQATLILKDLNFIARHRLEPTAFTRRRKLPFERIVSTLIHLVRNSLQIVCNRLWKVRRIIAADGSTLRLPESSDTLAHFGRFNCGKNVQADACPVMGRISEFTDVMSGLTISAALLPISVGEESMAEGQLQLVAEKMRSWGQDKLLFVYDRGYPSKQFVLSHFILKVDFVFRIPAGFNKQIDAFVANEWGVKAV